MTDARCPKCGEASSDPEFCSECGAAMGPAAAPAAQACPVCGEARPSAAARYCDTCRYDFQTGQPFAAAPPPPSSPQPAPTHANAHWDARVCVDLSLRRDGDPMPDDERERIYPLDHAEHLVGRRSDKDDIHPEIALADPGISRRHLRLLRGADGALAALDLGSTNGTKLNGTALEPNVKTALAAGDQITLGCWTRIMLEPR